LSKTNSKSLSKSYFLQSVTPSNLSLMFYL